MPVDSVLSPLLPDDPAFMAGMEFGMLYMRLSRGDARFRDLIRSANRERVAGLAARLGYEVLQMRPHMGEWLHVTMRKREAA